MKIILCGYHWAGCRALDILSDLASEIYVYTHDSPYHIPDLKALCESRNIRFTTQPISHDNLPFKPDILISIYYRFIISKDILNVCEGKAINLHPSLLPNYRGCSSLTWAMINNEREVGFTYHYIDEGIDTGNILLQKPLPIYEWDTQGSLYYRVMFEALAYLNEGIEKVLAGDPGQVQLSKGTYYKRGCPFNGEIQPDWSHEDIVRFIKAMTFPPYPPAQYQGVEIRSFEDFLNVKNKVSQSD